ncbi:MAG TPA: DNA polymerase III subunit epsilon [Chloroflexus aurantiacus]|jgi:DNA polymerase-3 subunit epsilon/ATP-dependent DNA helicase DinG|uniref:3'-5' exonuclease DinG n=1 Tax=Chloroflexus aurantiacus (strain ATCC 29366 / DSM 635 / J-10-fl) TaxID=324602 RepID=A9WBN2_CHLAA|nr:helicase C-terminal domain-containing protein [Chloroflexus aurantiacus]ABY34839.1 DNA polymerase III, epsilon subunit [Chloroflexus aurantiacus J-10-fl]RMG48890.1 MAG: DNA polymerase III subunit epsilon [Chloroflexota bacterium]HBW67740.1 DNA polymerase III subunit epsilon [Chloroflexus aurantiacus]
MNNRIYVAIDVETTGLQSGLDEIIEVAAVTFRGHEILDRFEQLVRPRQAVPLKITRLTGIDPAALAQAPRFNEIGADLARFIGNRPIVGHSIGFDLTMLRAQGMQFNQPVYDTFELATLLLPQVSSYKLSALAAHLGIPHPDAHRALNDAEVTARLFAMLSERMLQLDLATLSEMVRLMGKIGTPLRDLFEEALRQKARNAFRDPILAQQSTGTISAEPTLFSSAPDTGSPELPPLRPTGDTRPLDLDQIADLFSPEGVFGRAFPGYEPRPPQIEMARAVATAFNHSEPLIVEAGTGTGKSMAYLVPATLYAAQRGERVVISTNTINLQDQLYNKDIPDLQRIFATAGLPTFRAALLKGRSNYLCLKRYHELRRLENLTTEEVRALLKIQLWLPTTTSGDRTELPLVDREQSAWNRVNVSVETCTGARCPHFRECYFFRARRAAESAHLVVVNHALLIADLAAASQVLPPYDHLVIDEAHNLEDVATDQLSFNLDQASLLKFLDDLFQTGGAQVVSGLLSELPAVLSEIGGGGAAGERITAAIERMRPSLIRARTAVYECFNLLTRFVQLDPESGGQYDTRLRLTKGVRQRPEWQEIELAWQNLNDILALIGNELAGIEVQLRELEEAAGGLDDLLLRTEVLRRFATDARVRSGHVIFGDDDSICWLTYDRQRDVLTLTAAPLSVAEILQSQLFAQKQTSILASATLSIAGTFDFVKSRIGLEDCQELMLDSPFDYAQQALVYIPNDIPEPNQRGYQPMIEQAIIDLAIASGGRMLALFTASNALRQTYTAIQEVLEDHGIGVMAQGIDGSRKALVDRLKEFPRSVLLGTNSFWEGVDVVGDALSVLVITKLPFAVPTDPIVAARSELFTDPFNEYSVPQSILRFKQGFGRLIRSREDRGIVVVLDRRLLTKKYGQQFLDSLPPTRVRTGTLASLPGLVARFLQKVNGSSG